MTITSEIQTGYFVRVKVFQHSNDFLVSVVWTFFYRVHKLELESYITFERKTKRHKYSLVEIWIGNDKRKSNLAIPPEIPAEVRTAALEKFCATLEVLK